jgi:hypothetical protein
VPKRDPGIGVSRHADTSYDLAIEKADCFRLSATVSPGLCGQLLIKSGHPWIASILATTPEKFRRRHPTRKAFSIED